MGPDDPAEVAPTPTPSAPAAKASGSETGSKTVVSTVWPNGDFVIEDLPTITREGTEVDSSQLAQVKELADLCGVKLQVSGGAQ
jgi:hypothetical protein